MQRGGPVRRRLVVVPHTHWDREWYRTHEQFRYRLVGLMDGLLDLLEGDPAFRHFTLDGQTIVVDDYLEVRPEARERLAKLVAGGRLLVGPWYVLPDEWLVSGEALIRNLRTGLSRSAALGGALAAGYVPDQFGHVGQLPQILAGFGMREAILWRGVGQDVDGTLFRWQAPDGTALLTVHLLHGYGNAAHLPLEPGALAARLGELEAGLAPHSPIPSLLLMNGSDHLEPQPGLPAALDAAAQRMDDVEVEMAGLAGYLARVRAEAPPALALHRGELRSGLRAPLLEGCASARMPQKRLDFACDRLLTRYLEPLCAWLAECGGDADPGVLTHAWRLALQNHPHDSICGCSIDAVHQEMDQRFARLAQLCDSHLQRVQAELGHRVALPPGAGGGAIVWNPHGTGRVAFEGSLELDAPDRAAALHLRRGDGRRVPVSARVERPSALLADYELPGRVAALLLRGFPGEFMGLVPAGVRLRVRASGPEAEVRLAEAAPPGLDFTVDREAVAERLEALGQNPVRYRVRRLARFRLRGVDELPGFGLATYRVAGGRAGNGTGPVGQRRPDGAVEIRNATWCIEAAPDGSLRWEHLPSGAAVADALRLVSEGDRGDEYNFDPVPGGEVVSRPARARVRLLPARGAEAALRIEARYRVPAGLGARRDARASRDVWLPARLTLRLLEGLDRVDVEIELENTARDHRLRAVLRAPFAATRFEVESAFEVAERPIAPAPDAFGSARPAEWPIGATPQRRFASLAGADRAFTVANRGSAEVEALREPDGSSALAVTVLRAVGWLSRGDLALRPGLAGPPLETPGAQVPGPHRAELSFRLHRAGEPSRCVEAHRFAAPALLFGGGGARGPLGDGARMFELDDPRVLVSAVEPTPEGPAQLRLYNACDEPCRPRLRWCARPDARLEPVDLLGRPDPGVAREPAADGSLRLSLRPWQIVTLQAR
jgi:hypothetical protein